MKRIPLSRRVFIVVAAAVGPLAIMSGIALYAGYKQQRDQAERSGLDIARAHSTSVDAELRRTISSLEVLAQARDLDTGDLAAFHQRARRAAASQPQWARIVLFDIDGKSLLATDREFGQPTRAAMERASLDELLRKQLPVVGYLARGEGGNYAFPVRVPVFRDGGMRYVLTAVVDPGAILSVISHQRTPGDWVVAVADARGVRVARTREAEQSVGTPFSSTLVAMMERSPNEGTGVTHTSEGDSVFTAFTRSPDTGWYTAVGQPTALVDSSARHSFVVLGSGILLSLVMGAIVALMMSRRITEPMERLRQSALARTRGDAFVAPETDVREIHDVAAALMQASEAREEALRGEQAARAAAEAANRAKDEFLAMLGHELRNPLGAISNATSLLESGKLPPEAMARTRGVISRQVSQLARLTDDLLDAGRALMGKTVLRRQPLDLAAIAMQSLATLRSSNRLDSHRIIEDVRSAWVDADPVRLEQVIANLVGNAVKYTPAGGTIRVCVAPEDGDAVLRVIDDGMGLAPELAARVFDLFVQGERSLDRAEGGLGIGLTLVRRLAEMHGGSAAVRSDGPGKGSEFIVRLPAIEPVHAPQAAHPAALPDGRSRTILLVEDNVDALETLRVLLELSGHRVETALDGVTGLEKALAMQPDIALVDVGLPQMDGYELARRVRASSGMRRPLLVAITGYGSPEDRRRSLDAGFDAHLTKPVDPQALLALIGSAPALQEASQSRPSSH